MNDDNFPEIPEWLKVVLLPVTILLMFLAFIYMIVLEVADGVWRRMILMARREW